MEQENFTLLMRTIIVDSTKMRNDPISQFDINFRFSFQTYDTNWIVEQETDLWQFYSRRISVMTEKLISLNLRQFSNYIATCETLGELLKDWPVMDSTRRIAVDFVWRRTRHEIMFILARYNNTSSINLHFHLATLNTNVFGDEEFFDGEGDDTGCGMMIPATEASIASLKTKVVEDGSCAICSEDLRESFCMPCFHVFHGDCITTWLKISHYCPLCRFEMPTAAIG